MKEAIQYAARFKHCPKSIVYKRVHQIYRMKSNYASKLLCVHSHHLALSIDVDILILGYRIDSRLVIPGDLFFAVKGARVDGHLFLSEAKQKGALAAVVDRKYQGPSYGLILLVVDDVVEALRSLAQFSLLQTLPFLVAVTGSVGKTATKEFIAALA